MGYVPDPSLSAGRVSNEPSPLKASLRLRFPSMSSTSPLGQRSTAPEATSFLVFALASALVVYALKTRGSEVRAETSHAPSAGTFAIPAELDERFGDAIEFTPVREITTRDLERAPARLNAPD